MQLYIGNKRYSSWSLRPWLVMTHFGLPFEEILILLDEPDTTAKIRAVSPSGRVPCLVDGDVTVWETLAIIEYLAERFPEHAIWPRDARRLFGPAERLPNELAPDLRLSRPRASGGRRCRPDRIHLARCPAALRPRRPVPIRYILCRRCDVCACRLPARRLQLAGH